MLEHSAQGVDELAKLDRLRVVDDRTRRSAAMLQRSYQAGRDGVHGLRAAGAARATGLARSSGDSFQSAWPRPVLRPSLVLPRPCAARGTVCFTGATVALPPRAARRSASARGDVCNPGKWWPRGRGVPDASLLPSLPVCTSPVISTATALGGAASARAASPLGAGGRQGLPRTQPGAVGPATRARRGIRGRNPRYHVAAGLAGERAAHAQEHGDQQGRHLIAWIELSRTGKTGAVSSMRFRRVMRFHSGRGTRCEQPRV